MVSYGELVVSKSELVVSSYKELVLSKELDVESEGEGVGLLVVELVVVVEVVVVEDGSPTVILCVNAAARHSPTLITLLRTIVSTL